MGCPFRVPAILVIWYEPADSGSVVNVPLAEMEMPVVVMSKVIESARPGTGISKSPAANVRKTFASTLIVCPAISKVQTNHSFAWQFPFQTLGTENK
jgi:hypothetical protein